MFFFILRLRCRQGTFAVGGTGVTLGLLGFSFGKKKEEDEVDRLTLKYRDARLAHSQQDLKAADGFYLEALKVITGFHTSKLSKTLFTDINFIL